MPEPTTQEIMEAVKTLHDSIENKTADSAEKEAKINAFLDKQEDLNQKRTLADQKAKESSDEQLKMIQDLEIAVAHSSNESKDYKDSAEYKELTRMCVSGEVDRESKALRTDNDVSGGYLVPEQMDNLIVKNITEIKNIRGRFSYI